MFEPMNFISNLSYMAEGMISIFVVIGIIVILTNVINLMGRKKKDNNEE